MFYLNVWRDVQTVAHNLPGYEEYTVLCLEKPRYFFGTNCVLLRYLDHRIELYECETLWGRKDRILIKSNEKGVIIKE